MLIEDITRGTQDRDAERVARFILNNPGISRRDLARASGLRAHQIDAVTLRLEGQERIVVTRQGANRVKYYPAVEGVEVSTVKSVGAEVSAGVDGRAHDAPDTSTLPTPGQASDL